MRTVLILLVIASFAGVAYGGGTDRRVESVVLAKFIRGAITLPEGRNELTLAEAMSIPGVLARSELADELSDHGVVRLRQIVPDFNPTIVDRYGKPVTNADGEVLTVPHDLSLWYALDLSHDDVEGVCSSLVESPDIEVAEPDWLGEAMGLPNDPYFNRQWGLRNTGQYGGVPYMDMKAKRGWERFGTGTYRARVAVLDWGIDFDHPDFYMIEDGANFSTAGPPTDDDIGRWHGTAVAGIIGMKGNNGIGGAGVGWCLTIVPVKVATQYDTFPASRVVAGLDWARSQGIKVVNMSFGKKSFSLIECEAVRNNRAAGMTNIASAGNDNSSGPHYPSGYSRHCLSVNAFMMNGDRWVDSTRYLLCGLEDSPYGSNYGPTLDLTAPGGRGIFTTKHSVYDDGYYEVTDPSWSCRTGDITDWEAIDAFGGTSAAAAYVSGAAGLILATNPDLDGEDAERILIRTAKDAPQSEPGWDEYFGWGRPDLEAALELASPAYVVERVTGVSGGTAAFDGTGRAQFWGIEGLAPGVYGFKRYRVDKTMALETPYTAQPVAWGRVQGSIGWPRINNGDFFDLTDEDAGTTIIVAVSGSSITLRTYYYDLYDILGRYVGRFPNNGSVRFSFTAIGPVSTAGVEDVSSAVGRVVLDVVPNPGSSQVEIRLVGGKISPGAVVSIYDVLGRRVRRLVVGRSSTIVWDLCGDDGGKVVTGMYFVRLEVGGASMGMQRVLVVR